MIRANLIKGMMLGMCMSAMMSATAFAQMTTTSTPVVKGEITAEENALYEKQKEVDQYVFVDHLKEIEDMGFMVNYTGVAKDYVEIGIAPFSEENAKYLYDAFGKESVKVVAYDESVMYATTIVDDAVTEEVAVDSGSVKEEMNETVKSDNSTSAPEDVKMYKGGDVQIQIESISEEATEVDPEVIYQTTAVDAEDSVVLEMTAEEKAQAVKRNTESEQEGVSAPIMVLAIAGGALLIGGTAFVTLKKR